jgi:predicted amidophosphoribosyltransferase
MRRWGEWLDLVFPRACALCNHPLVEPAARSLCGRCFDRLHPIGNGCLRCGAPLGNRSAAARKKPKNQRARCEVCEKSPLEMTRVFAFTVYEGTAIRVARKMKEPRYEPLAEQIGRSVAVWLLQVGPFAVEHYDAFVPIPQHWFRRLSLRYNHSEVLAAGLSAVLGCPVEDRWLHRTRWTPKQGMKTIAERRKNMHRGFDVPEKYTGRIQGRRFLLVDDVMTSGATLDQAAWALKQRGALMVDAVVFARGLGARKSSLPGPPPATDFPQKPRTLSAKNA